MQIIILGAVLIGLAVLLGFIVVRTIAMIRQRRPLLAIGPVQWHAPIRPEAPVAEPAAAGAPAAATGFGRAASAEPTPPPPPPSPEPAPARERTRKLVSISELAQADSAEPLVEAGYCDRVEQQLETAFDALCDGAMDLDAYTETVDQLHSEAKRLQLNLGPLADETLYADVAQAISALEWCRDWARQQAA